VAGYPEEMRYFLDSNPGLESRFNKYLTFDDYTPDELLLIFQGFCTESQYKLDADATSKLESLFQSAFQHRDAHFGNARLARNAFEHAITTMATRIVNLQKVEDSALETIQATDIPDAIATGTTTPFPQSS
jgi:AAA lid domain-containing protein